MTDGQETRRRLLAAAAEEFATFGIAGARVDRIAANARANKAQMYAWYGNKEAMFDVVLGEHLERIVNTVPLDATDLPSYAARLYDSHAAHPELIRLATWHRLERVPTGDLFADHTCQDTTKLTAIEQAQRDGTIDPNMRPIDVLSLVTAMSLAWSPASVTVATGPGDSQDEHDRRREALADTVRRAFAPPAPPTQGAAAHSQQRAEARGPASPGRSTP